MTEENLLDALETKGVEVAKIMRERINELQEQASVAVAMKGALASAAMQNSTNEGRRTFQTLLTAVAHGVDQATTMTVKRRAELLGVRERAFSEACQRAKRSKDDIHPDEAIREGAYWFQPRATRKDATCPELLLLMRQYWHTDAVSRATGNSSDGDMWKGSKSPVADCHPRRQLTQAGGGDALYAEFLKWADYRGFKARQGDDFKDPGRTLFLSTRCKCLIPPVR